MDTAKADVEVRVRMLNINYDHNRELMEVCRPLSEYAWFVEEIRENRKNMEIEEAVDRAIDIMPENFEIKKFLIGNRAEVKDMCITEYNEAETMQMFKEEGLQEGLQKGLQEGLQEGLQKGLQEGEDRLGELMRQLLESGRISDAQKAAADKVARERFYKEFDIL